MSTAVPIFAEFSHAPVSSLKSDGFTMLDIPRYLLPSLSS
jgi:hypothetical protein